MFSAQTTTIRVGNSQVSKNKWSINPNDAVMLLIDHQTGLFQLVRDIEQIDLRNNVIALAKVAKLANMPTFTTASVPEGPNGPLIPEIHESNPNAVYIPRTGQINAWDNPEWVKAIEKTGRKTLIIAGTLTSVCMTFPTLSALEAGYKVFCVIDASGNHSKMATELAMARVTQAGAHPIDTFAVQSEIMATWNRDDAWQFAGVMMDHIVPTYKTIADFAKILGEKNTPQTTATMGDKDLMTRLGKVTSGIQMTTSQT
jgi:nicotinamidase-related amidase